MTNNVLKPLEKDGVKAIRARGFLRLKRKNTLLISQPMTYPEMAWRLCGGMGWKLGGEMVAIGTKIASEV